MGIIEIGMVLTMLGVVTVYGSWAMARAVSTAERQGKLSEDEATHQRAIFGRVRYWAIRALLVAVWVLALGFIIEVARQI